MDALRIAAILGGILGISISLLGKRLFALLFVILGIVLTVIINVATGWGVGTLFLVLIMEYILFLLGIFIWIFVLAKQASR